MNAIGMSEAVQDGLLSNDAALRWHLEWNHFPPVHEVFLPVVKEALELARKDCWEVVLELPNGRELSVLQVVEQLHLHEFL